MSQAGSLRGSGSGIIQTIAGDTGSITGANVTIYTNNGNILSNAGKTVLFENSGTVSQLKVTDVNLNTLIGYNLGIGAISGINNTGFGAAGFNSLSSGSRNTGLGVGLAAALTSGSANIFVGFSPASNLTTGGNNIIIGSNSSGDAYTGNESNNIIFDNVGVVGDNNTIRIGTVTEQTRNFQAGITGITVAASAPTAIASTGQLSSLGFGTAGEVLTSGGTGVSPSWQAGSATTVNFKAYQSAPATKTASSTAEVIVCDQIITNVGSGYNGATGVFTCPVSGFYVFSAVVYLNKITSAVGATNVLLAFTGNAESLRLCSYGIGATVNSINFIPSVSWSMQMTAGDTVYIQPYIDGAGTYEVYGAALSSLSFSTSTTFSGALIA